jgi:hypothetical protein
MKSKMQEAVTLSVTEAGLVAATTCIQEMMYTKNIVESMGLKVKSPMELYEDNKGVKDLINGWSVTGRTRHIEVHYFFLHKLKKEGIAKVESSPTVIQVICSEKTSTLSCSRNIPKDLFKKCDVGS